MLYVLLLPLLFIFILFIRFFDRMDEKIHLRTILAWIFSPITALYYTHSKIVNYQLSIVNSFVYLPFQNFSLFTKIYGKRNPTNEAVQSDKKQIS